ASTENEIETAFATLLQMQSGALLVGADPYLSTRREQLTALAGLHAIPAMYEWREFVTAGGLISYGTRLSSVYRQAGALVGRILGGAKPYDLPIEQPTQFALVVN